MTPYMQFVDKSYYTVVYGYDEPDFLLLPEDIFREFISSFTLSPPKNGEVFMFNNSRVERDEQIATGRWALINTKHIRKWRSSPVEARYHGYFSLEDQTWNPLPKEIMDRFLVKFPLRKK